MNPYLKTGGRIVGALMLCVGVVCTAAGLAVLVHAVPFLMSRSPSSFTGTWRGFREIEVAVGLGAIAYFCFRYWSRLKKEERDGVQI